MVSTTPAVIGGRPRLRKQREEIKEDVQGQLTQGVQEHTYSNPHSVHIHTHRKTVSELDHF